MPVILVSAEMAISEQFKKKVPTINTQPGCVTQVLESDPSNVKFFYQAVTTAGMSGAPIVFNQGTIIGVGMHIEAAGEDFGVV